MTKQVRQALGLLCVAALALIVGIASTSEDLAAIGMFVAVITGGVALVTLALELLRD